jgi:hypothetical protein
MKYKKSQSDVSFILGVLVFNAFVILALGFLNINNDNNVTTETHGLEAFSMNIISNITLLGWGNTLIFTPLILCIIYLVGKFIRGI